MATLVAETGGQNAMIVDSTALLEQVTDDVIQFALQAHISVDARRHGSAITSEL